jgi:hypothetical protein
MGIPFDVPMVQEKREGIIDVEALLFITLLMMERDRMVTDIPAWIIRFRDLINFQKLKTIFITSPEKYKSGLIAKLNQTPSFSPPAAFRKLFGLHELPSTELAETVRMRSSKLNTVNHVARASLMLNSRLLYGTGFRADLITLTHVKSAKMNGKQLAELLCTANSTISRILKDLRACQFLDEENERVRNPNPYPGMFLSTQSVWNLYEILDAEEFRSEELKRAAHESLNFKHDKFGTQLIKKTR